MKLSFEKHTQEYIGNELDDLNYIAPRGKERSLGELGDYVHIGTTQTKLFQFIVEQYDNSTDLYYRDFIEKILTSSSQIISSLKYAEIEDTINKHFSDLLEFKDDFAFFLLIVQKRCYSILDYHDDLIKGLGDKTKGDIEQFYSRIVDKDVDVLNITIEYNKNKYGDTEKLSIETPRFVKMMLFQFAKRYYTRVKQLDVENWEFILQKKLVDEYLIEEEKRRRGNSPKKEKVLLKPFIKLFHEFARNTDSLEKISEFKTYVLLGLLLSVIGYKKFNVDMSYKDEPNYYYRTLSSVWKPEK